MSEGYDGASNFPYIDFVKKYMKKEEMSWNCAVCDIKEKGLWVNSKDRKREERRVRRDEKKAMGAEDKPKKKPPAKKKEPKTEPKTEPEKIKIKVKKTIKDKVKRMSERMTERGLIGDAVEVKEDVTEKITIPKKKRVKLKIVG